MVPEQAFEKLAEIEVGLQEIRDRGTEARGQYVSGLEMLGRLRARGSLLKGGIDALREQISTMSKEAEDLVVDADEVRRKLALAFEHFNEGLRVTLALASILGDVGAAVGEQLKGGGKNEQ